MTKRDWAFVAACVAGALVFGVWSVRMGIAFHRAQHGITELSSSRRHAAEPPAPGNATLDADDTDDDDVDRQTGQKR